MIRERLLVVALTFGAGVVAAGVLGLESWSYLTIAAAFFAAVLCRRGKTRLAGALLLLVAIAAVGALRLTHAETLPSDHILRAAQDSSLVVEGVVASAPVERAGSSRFVFDVKLMENGSTVSGRVSLFVLKTSRRYESGDRLRLSLAATVPSIEQNPGGWNRRAVLASRGVEAEAFVRDDSEIIFVRNEASAWTGLVSQVRRAMRGAFHRHLTGEPAGLLDALILGDRSALSDETVEDFRRGGVVHLLVVSGLHVGFVVFVLWAVFSSFGVRWLVWIAVGFGVVLYASVVGWTAPVGRAAWMALVFVGGRALRRESSSWSPLAAAFLIALVIEPRALFSFGFQLSFAAVAGIIYFFPRVRRLVPRSWASRTATRCVADAAIVTVGAQLGVAPLLAMHSGTVAWASLPGTLLLAPVAGLLVAVGLTLVVFTPLGLGLIVSYTAWFVGEAFLLGASAVASLPSATVVVGGEAGWVLLAATIFLAALLSSSKRLVRAAIFAFAITANVFVWHGVLASSGKNLEVTFLDVGNGLSAHVRLPDGSSVLYDGGPLFGEHDAGASIVLPYLRFRGVTRLRAIVSSHTHCDHLGGLVSVFDGCRVDEVWTTGVVDSSSVHLFERCAERGVPVRVLRAGDVSCLGGARVEVFSPPDDFIGHLGRPAVDENETSLVLRFAYGETSVLLTADAGALVEVLMLSEVSADVVQVGHQGSATSSTREFVDRVNADVAVVSVGGRNPWGHPVADVLSRWRSAGATVYETSQCGAVTTHCDGEVVFVSTHRSGG
jgi:competence protein ComEC